MLRLFRSRRRRGFVLVLAITVTLCLSWRSYTTYRDEQDLQQLLQRLNAQDPGWTLETLTAQLPKIPDEQNAALMIKDLYAKVFLATKSAMNSWQRYRTPYVELFEFVNDHPQARLPAVLRDAMTKRLTGQPLADHLRRARELRHCTTGRFPLRPFLFYTRPFGSSVYQARELADVLALDAQFQLEAENWESAVQDIEALLGFSRACGDSVDLDALFVRPYLLDLAAQVTQRWLAQSPRPSVRHLLRLQEEFTRAEATLMPWPMQLRFLRAVYDEDLRSLHAGKTTLSDVIYTAYSHTGSLFKSLDRWPWIEESIVQTAPTFCIPSWSRPGTWARERATLLRHYTEAIEWGGGPEHELSACWRHWRETGTRVSPFVAHMIMAMNRSSYQQKGDMDALLRGLTACHLVPRANCRAVVTAVAAERYRRDHGTWPRAWSQLVPSYLPTAPNDPWTGKPLTLGATGDGLVIYSIGRNEEDDGGQVIPSARGDVGIRLWNSDRRRTDLSDRTKRLEDALRELEGN